MPSPSVGGAVAPEQDGFGGPDGSGRLLVGPLISVLPVECVVVIFVYIFVSWLRDGVNFEESEQMTQSVAES